MSTIPKNCNDCAYCLSTGSSTFKCNHSHGTYLNLIYPNERNSECPLTEDELDAIRYRVNYRKQSLYLTIVTKEGKPLEIFAEHPSSGDPIVYYMMASIDAITRLVTMSMKMYPLHRVVNQLVKASRVPHDFPGIVASKLQLWL